MRKKVIKYTCYIALSTSLLLTTVMSVACSNGPEIPKMTVSYGPEIGFADGNVNLAGENPVINISDIKAQVGMNIDYLSGVVVENESEFPDLEIWVDASMVDIFTAGDYKATYTFVYNGQSVSKDITVTLEENEQSASDVPSDEPTSSKNNNSGSKPSESETTSGNQSSSTTANTNKNTTVDNSSNTTKPAETTSRNENTAKPPATTTQPTTSTVKPPATTTQPTTSTVKPPATTTPSGTTKPAQTTTKETTTRQIITTAGNKTTELKNIGNYTIELLSCKNITIKNTTDKYIVSTRTDVTTVEEGTKVYRISKLIITYNTGFEQILETVKERIK